MSENLLCRPHWWKGKTLHADPSQGYVPVAYSSGDTVTAGGTWIAANTDAAIEDDLYAYFELSHGGAVFRSTHQKLEKNANGTWSLSDAAELFYAFSYIFGKQAMHDPGFQLTWKFYIDADGEGEDVTKHRNSGTSTSCLYVTYENPVTKNFHPGNNAALYHSIVHAGCVAAAGKNTDQAVFAAIWDKIKSRSNHSVHIQNGAVMSKELLYYYGKSPVGEGVTDPSSDQCLNGNILAKRDMNGVVTTPQSLSHARECHILADTSSQLEYLAILLYAGDGFCNSWERYMIAVLAAQGLQSTGISLYPTIEDYGELFEIRSDMVGQGGVTPKEFIFVQHKAVVYGGNVYDPSYGLEYGSSQGTSGSRDCDLAFTQNVVSVGERDETPSSPPGNGHQQVYQVNYVCPINEEEEA